MTHISDQKFNLIDEDMFWKKACMSGLQEKTF